MGRKFLWLTASAVFLIVGCTTQPKSVPTQLTAQPLTATTPIVNDTNPNQGMAVDKSVFVHFNRPMDPASLTNNTLFIPNVASTITYDSANHIAYIKPNASLTPSTTYKPTVTIGVRSIDGVNAPVGYTFLVHTRTTTDTSPPNAVLIDQGCVSPDGSISVRFSEPMNSLTINTSTFVVTGVSGSVSYDSLTHIATFTPDSPFAAGTTYQGTITTGAQDVGGVGLGANYDFSFTTCPGNQPKNFCSYTKGGYAGPGAPGQLFDTWFPVVFAEDLTIGINDGTAGPLHDARWLATSPGPENLKAYLTSPAGGPSAIFPSDETNPAATANGQLPEQVAALTLNVGFSGVGGDPVGFGHLRLTGTGTSLDGATIDDILGFANYALAGNGLPAGYTFSSLNDLITNINSSWDDCQQSDWAKAHLQ